MTAPPLTPLLTPLTEWSDLPTRAHRAYAVLDFVMANPDMHDQGLWVADDGEDDFENGTIIDRRYVEQHCGTTACFAGWAVLLSGRAIDADNCVITGTDPLAGLYVPHAAAELLRLSEVDADDLFLFSSRADLPAAIRRIYGPRPADMPTPVTVATR